MVFVVVFVVVVVVVMVVVVVVMMVVMVVLTNEQGVAVQWHLPANQLYLIAATVVQVRTVASMISQLHHRACYCQCMTVPPTALRTVKLFPPMPMLVRRRWSQRRPHPAHHRAPGTPPTP